MEFGIQIEPQFGFNFEDVSDIANAALEFGFSTLWFSDHFMLNADATDEVLLDPWLLMTALVRENKIGQQPRKHGNVFLHIFIY